MSEITSSRAPPLAFVTASCRGVRRATFFMAFAESGMFEIKSARAPPLAFANASCRGTYSLPHGGAAAVPET